MDSRFCLTLMSKKRFFQGVNDILGDNGYVVVCCSILKEPYIRQYGKLNDVYGLSLSYIMERVVFYLDSLGLTDIELCTIIEKRGKKKMHPFLIIIISC